MNPALRLMAAKTAAGAAYFFEDDWTGVDGEAWNASRWAQVNTYGSGTTVTIQGNGGQVSTTAGGYIGANAMADTADIADLEFLVRLNLSGLTERYPAVHLRGGTATPGGVKPATGYSLRIDAHSAAHSGYARIIRESGGSGELASTPITVSTSMMMRGQAQGTALRLRVWNVGDSEPGAWTLQTTDASFSTGRIWVTCEMGAATEAKAVTFDDLQVTAI